MIKDVKTLSPADISAKRIYSTGKLQKENNSKDNAVQFLGNTSWEAVEGLCVETVHYSCSLADLQVS